MTQFSREIYLSEIPLFIRKVQKVSFLVVDNFIFETFVEDNAPHGLIFLQLRKILY